MTTKGRGGIRSRKPGHWELRLTIDGRQHSRTITGERSDAEGALEAWVAEVTKPNFGQLLSTWVERSADRRSSRADSEVRRIVATQLIPSAGRWELDSITTGRLEQLYADLRRGRNLSASTIRKVHYIVRPALRLAVRWGHLSANPADAVELAPLRGARVEPPSVEAMATLLAAATEASTNLFLRLLIITGGRRGEVAGLRWDDVEWLASAVVVRRALSVVGDSVVVKEPKTRAGRRPIAVDDATLAQLEAWRSHLEAALVPTGEGCYVFPATDRDYSGRTPVHPDAWSARWRKVRAAAGVHCRMHDLRHASGSWLLSDGIDPIMVSRRLGHSRTSVTLDVYGHVVVPSIDRQAADLLAARLPAAAPRARPTSPR